MKLQGEPIELDAVTGRLRASSVTVEQMGDACRQERLTGSLGLEKPDFEIVTSGK